MSVKTFPLLAGFPHPHPGQTCQPGWWLAPWLSPACQQSPGPWYHGPGQLGHHLVLQPGQGIVTIVGRTPPWRQGSDGTTIVEGVKHAKVGQEGEEGGRVDQQLALEEDQEVEETSPHPGVLVAPAPLVPATAVLQPQADQQRGHGQPVLVQGHHPVALLEQPLQVGPGPGGRHQHLGQAWRRGEGPTLSLSTPSVILYQLLTRQMLATRLRGRGDVCSQAHLSTSIGAAAHMSRRSPVAPSVPPSSPPSTSSAGKSARRLVFLIQGKKGNVIQVKITLHFS